MKKIFLFFALLFGCVAMTFAQRTVTGNITDNSGLPLIGANVLVKGTTIGTITDVDGNYSLEVPDGNNMLVISYTGYSTQELDITGTNTVNITLAEGEVLQEVVVTALGIERDEKSLGYAVTKIDGSDVSRAKETNIVNSLQGKVAGVQIAGSPSALGGSSRITIRGANSFLGNNQPLFVVDGIPIDNGNLSGSSQQRGFGGAIAYDYGNAASDIDPESVASVTVLKGAAATALYGQRGANGVIQITTKSGAGKKGLGVEFSNQFSFEKVRNLIPHQREYGGGDIAGTASGFYEVIQDGVTYLTPAYSKDGAWGPKYDPNSQIRHWDSWDPDNPDTYKETRPWVAPNSDYQDFFETGATRTTNVGLTGGNDLGNFRFGYTNLDSKGTIPNGSLKRNSFSLKSGYDIHDRINVNVKANYTITEGENRNITGYNNGNPMQAFTQWWQTQLDVDRLKNSTRVDGSQQTWNAVGPVVDGSGNLLFYDASPNFFDNPYWVRDNYLQNDQRNRFIGGAGLTVDLAEGLTLVGNVGTDFYQSSDVAGIPIASVETALYREREIRFTETNYEARLNYNTDLTERISLNAFVGGNRMRQSRRSSTAETSGGLSLEGFYNISNSAAAPSFTTFEQNKGINSAFGAASFGFDNWLYLDVTARNDWSSTLPAGENSYFYPSLTVSGVLSELGNFDPVNGLSFLKVRASYAQAGNDADPYQLFDVFSPQTPNFGSNPRYGVPNAQNNPFLKPELTTEIEFGVDARFFADRLGIDLAYFKRNTKDQIFSVPASAATGYTSRILNSGEMENSGIEVQIYGTPIETKDFSLNVGFNVSKLDNKVVELAEGVESINMGGTWAADLRVQQGQKYMALYGQDYIYDDNGNKVVDETGAYQFTDDRVFLGSALADWIGGFTADINYKGFTLGGLVDFQMGGVMHSTSLQWAKYSGMHPETVEYNGQTGIRETGMILEGVKEDGSANDVAIDPQTYYQTYWRRAAPNVYSTDFVKLRELSLGYTIPNSILNRTGIRDLTIGIIARNLAILSSDIPFIDPQVVSGAGNRQGLENAQIPPTSSVGLNISFKL
ncbi:MAG: SusC/RagA family TonB-linked outer membrane protein [Saprospiraceae bacterium]|nr:SusC/RagA family TonB-linked outer membrane protein [Saprospiraceae bacterium]